MHSISTRGINPVERSRSKLLMVAVGIVLFVVGFMLTIAAIPQSERSESSDVSISSGNAQSGTSPEIFLMSGMLVSLTGVVLATVGPAVGFVKRTSRE